MTKPIMKDCDGSGQEVDGMDEPDGTVSCNKCEKIFLRMKTATNADGKKTFSVPKHQCRANAPRSNVARVVPTRSPSRRDSGRCR